MPLVATSAGPGPQPPSSPRLLPKRITWTSPAGEVLDLIDDASGYRSLPGRSGFGMPPREIIYDSLPNGGGVLRHIRDQVRVLAVPLHVRGWTQDEYLTRLARLQRAFRHRRGGEDVPGTITVELPNGTRRWIHAFYNGGLDPSESVDDLLRTAQSFPRLEFLALDPYWTGGQVTGAWSAAAGTTFFGTMPVRLSASQVLGTVTVDLPGDADAYPVWTVVGPGVPIIGSITTGREFAWKPGSPIAAGRTVTIDTREETLAVVDDLGNNLYSSLEEFPDLWTLEPGTNELTVEVGSSTAATQVSFAADIRWQTGW